ncbi:hypothetical protein ACKLNR_012183 [Fusarium oxysporum f. sp. zingiberi]
MSSFSNNHIVTSGDDVTVPCFHSTAGFVKQLVSSYWPHNADAYKLRYKPNLTYQPTELQVLKQLQTPSGEKSLQGASGQFPLVWLWLLPR